MIDENIPAFVTSPEEKPKDFDDWVSNQREVWKQIKSGKTEIGTVKKQMKKMFNTVCMMPTMKMRPKTLFASKKSEEATKNLTLKQQQKK